MDGMQPIEIGVCWKGSVVEWYYFLRHFVWTDGRDGQNSVVCWGFTVGWLAASVTNYKPLLLHDRSITSTRQHSQTETPKLLHIYHNLFILINLETRLDRPPKIFSVVYPKWRGANWILFCISIVFFLWETKHVWIIE